MSKKMDFIDDHISAFYSLSTVYEAVAVDSETVLVEHHSHNSVEDDTEEDEYFSCMVTSPKETKVNSEQRFVSLPIRGLRTDAKCKFCKVTILKQI